MTDYGVSGENCADYYLLQVSKIVRTDVQYQTKLFSL